MIGAMIPDHAQLISRIAQERRVEVADLEQVERQTLAILVTDASGFTRSALQLGDLVALARIARMQDVIRPCIIDAGGMLVKFEADNSFSTYDAPSAAIGAALAIHRALAQDSENAPPGWHLSVGVGVGFGPLIGWQRDVFGAEINLASKLGEDVAHAGETLVTEATAHALRGTEYEARVTQAGRLPEPLALVYYRLR